MENYEIIYQDIDRFIERENPEFLAHCAETQVDVLS